MKPGFEPVIVLEERLIGGVTVCRVISILVEVNGPVFRARYARAWCLLDPSQQWLFSFLDGLVAHPSDRIMGCCIGLARPNNYE